MITPRPGVALTRNARSIGDGARRCGRWVGAMSVTLVMCLGAVSAAVAGPDVTGEIGGYGKYLFSYVQPAVGAGYVDHLVHARLNTKWYPLENLAGSLELRFRGYYGGSVERTPDFASTLKNRTVFGVLDKILWEGRTSVGYAEIDRLSLSWTPDRWVVTLGRQRIAWGTNLVWNPIDLFNPLSVLDFDYEERPAVDAVRIQYYTGAVSKVELSLKAGKTSDDVIAAALWTFNVVGYDVHLIGGRRHRELFTGMAWAGDILGGGFRGELLVSQMRAGVSSASLDAPARRRPASAFASLLADRLRDSGGPASAKKQWMASAAVSGDYTFPNTLYIHTEALCNIKGVPRNAADFRPEAFQHGLLSPARFSVYQEISYDITPLVRGSFFVIYNPDDHSAAVVPSVAWSAVENLDIMGIALRFTGRDGTEYGGLGTMVFLRAKYSF